MWSLFAHWCAQVFVSPGCKKYRKVVFYWSFLWFCNSFKIIFCVQVSLVIVFRPGKFLPKQYTSIFYSLMYTVFMIRKKNCTPKPWIMRTTCIIFVFEYYKETLDSQKYSIYLPIYFDLNKGSSINEVAVLRGRRSTILWRQNWGFSNKKRDDGGKVGGGQKMFKIAWRNLWKTPKALHFLFGLSLFANAKSD